MLDKVKTAEPTKHIVILGGGSAGWLTAGVIAAEHQASIKPEGGAPPQLSITLIESPGIPPIGVGEGTWPTMRGTLKKIGITETELFVECEASFKQGAKFAKWVTGEPQDAYYHPLVLPVGYFETDLIGPWLNDDQGLAFDDAVCFQGALCDQGLAPKQIKTPEYESVANYAYHLNSHKLGELLKKHCIEKLNVRHIIDHVDTVLAADNGDIAALVTRANSAVKGNLFIDCSGFASLLLGQHYGVPFLTRRDVLFNDRAIAVQVPYREPDSPITSHTISTAHSAGWIWDIGLPSRRGVGSVYSSSHCSDDQAHANLVAYIGESLDPPHLAELSFRTININPGHRAKFWHRNCVAVGMAAGFLEPLEASALVLVELSAAMISAELPANREVMDIVSKRFNQRFTHHWDIIIEFLKLHYILSRRTDSDYWLDHRDNTSVPESLQERLRLWRYHKPNKYDFPLAEEMFPTASWQYVLYGMGFRTETRNTATGQLTAKPYFEKVGKIKSQLTTQLPSNRELINKIHQFGLQRI